MTDTQTWVQEIVAALRPVLAARAKRPESTYRLQMERDKMSYQEAAAVVPYLRELGISHLYTSPDWKAKAGSPHGYAIVAYDALNPELGSEDDYRAMADALHEHGMGRLPDIVPNHMSAAPGENLWWTDVLENGPGSPYAGYFDIDWDPVKEELHNRILLPMLGGQYGEVLESGELKIEYHDGSFKLNLYGAPLPLDPKTYPEILARNLAQLEEKLPSEPAESPEMLELESILTALEHLPDRNQRAAEAVRERQREKEVVKKRLGQLVAQCPAVANFIQTNLAEINGAPGNPQSFDDLDRLLDAQVYRLAHWKAAGDEINYRRFFDINDLAAVSMEDPAVFEKAHRMVFEMLLTGDLSGLRIDHIDGLFDPTDYLWKLQRGWVSTLGKKILAERAQRHSSMPHSAAELAAANTGWASEPVHASTTAASGGSTATVETAARSVMQRRDGLAGPSYNNGAGPHGNGSTNGASGNGHADVPAWSDLEAPVLQEIFTGVGKAPLPLYVAVEKILGPEEPLPKQWPAAGTTGYDYLHWVNGVFVDAEGLKALTRLFGRFTGETVDFRELVHQSKLAILRGAMSSELQLLARRLNRLSERHRRFRDFTLNMLRHALREIIACFAVYRTYLRPQEISERDRHFVTRAVAQAKRRNPDMPVGPFDFVRDVLLFEQPAPLDAEGCREREQFVGRFQQVSSPVMAKGVEDTAFYRYFPLSSLNEVGDDPAGKPVTVEDFHRENAARQTDWPGSLLATTTHDTKRSEDTRARINVLSEIPQEWGKAVSRWSRLNRRHCREVDGQPAPSRRDEYLFYQSLFGIWPLQPPDEAERGQLVARLQAYMEKATHEAKLQTSWLNPNAEYDAAVKDFVARVLEGGKNRFLARFVGFQGEVARFGLFNALAQVLLKLASPGVPDIYQGQELWDFSLVDPDNRRKVDFDLRRKLLTDLEEEMARGPVERRALAQRLAMIPADPRMKLFVIWQTLQFRHAHSELFRMGHYVPLSITGKQSPYICAFAWRAESWTGSACKNVIVAVPRLVARMARGLEPSVDPALVPMGAAIWQDTMINLPAPVEGQLTNLFTGQPCAAQAATLRAADVFAEFPVALLSDGS